MTELTESSDKETKALLLGRRVVAVNAHPQQGVDYNAAELRYSWEAPDAILVLDDGTQLYASANEGCGGCGSGWYEIATVAAFDNIITNARLTADSGDDDQQTYRITVYSAGVKTGTDILTVTGDDGNGYYGTGYSITVRRASEGPTS